MWEICGKQPQGEPAKVTPKDEAKAAAKEPGSSKGKSAKDTLSRFFRSKVNGLEKERNNTVREMR